MNDVYPSVSELLPDLLLSRIPASLAETIAERYERLGPAYLTDKRHSDGRLINSCMFSSDTENAIEEIVDATFRILVRVFKERQYEPRIDDNTWACLIGLLELYSLLVTMQEVDKCG